MPECSDQKRSRIKEESSLYVNEVLLIHQNADLMGKLYRADYTTWRHSCNVAVSAAQISIYLGYKDSQIFEITLGALLHDIGKLSIPSDILNKPAALSEAERFIINQHPVMGQKMVFDLGYSDVILDIIRHHHENEAGTGYPDGLTEMAEETKIVSIADKYDALSGNRPYQMRGDEMDSRKSIMERFRKDYKNIDKIYEALYFCKGIKE